MLFTMEPNMIEAVLYAFYMTMELWIFLGILCIWLVGEELINQKRQRLVDNPTLR